MVKRCFDLSFASLTLCMVWPLILVLMALSMLQFGTPLYFQQRIGKNGRIFTCFKIRTMPHNAEQALQTIMQHNEALRDEWHLNFRLQNDPRVSRFNHWVRYTGLDELPQLVNIILGDMSVVGPRPITQCEIPLYGRYFRNYALVRPGLTGLWQLNKETTQQYRKRTAWDVLYTRRRNFWFDLRIIWLTSKLTIAKVTRLHVARNPHQKLGLRNTHANLNQV